MMLKSAGTTPCVNVMFATADHKFSAELN